MFQCGLIYVEPVETLHTRVATWIRGLEDADKLDMGYSLTKYFPNGPAPRTDPKQWKIDMIIVNRSSMFLLSSHVGSNSFAAVVLSRLRRRSRFPIASKSKSDAFLCL